MIKKVSKEGPETMDMMSYCYQEYRDIYIFELRTVHPGALTKYIKWNNNTEFFKFQIKINVMHKIYYALFSKKTN